MSEFNILDSREEDELHKARLLNVEEKPFKRITKHLLGDKSILLPSNKLPTPPPDDGSTDDASEDPVLKKRRAFHDDILFDFDGFDSFIARIQFLYNSNERERERYNNDKQRILDTMQEVRDSNAQLRLQLDEAKKTLEQRKKFDELAEKITSKSLLRPREDQGIALRKLEEECRELEKESQTYGETWKERREQFGRIVEEGMQLRRLIRDEKEEVERREGMDGGQEDGEVGEGSRGGQTPKRSSFSGNATPGPDTESQSVSGSALKPGPLNAGTLSRPGSRTTSRAPSPARSERDREGVQGEDSMIVDDEPKVDESDLVADTPMSEPDIPATPQVIIDEPSPVADTQVTQAAPEGEEAEDKMDTT